MRRSTVDYLWESYIDRIYSSTSALDHCFPAWLNVIWTHWSSLDSGSEYLTNSWSPTDEHAGVLALISYHRAACYYPHLSPAECGACWCGILDPYEFDKIDSWMIDHVFRLDIDQIRNEINDSVSKDEVYEVVDYMWRSVILTLGIENPRRRRRRIVTIVDPQGRI